MPSLTNHTLPKSCSSLRRSRFGFGFDGCFGVFGGVNLGSCLICGIGCFFGCFFVGSFEMGVGFCFWTGLVVSVWSSCFSLKMLVRWWLISFSRLRCFCSRI